MIKIFKMSARTRNFPGILIIGSAEMPKCIFALPFIDGS